MPVDPKTLRWADNELKKGNFSGAAEKLQYGLLVCSDDVEVRKKLRAISRKNRVQNQISGLGKIKHQAKLAKIKSRLSGKKNPAEFIEEAEKYLFEDPNNSEILLELAENLNKLEHYHVSEWVLDDLTKLEPKNHVVWKNLGKLYKDHLGNIDKAKDCYAMVQKLNPNDHEITKELRQMEAEHITATGATTARAALKDETETLRREIENRVIRNAEDARVQVKFLLEDLEEDPKNAKIMEKIADRYRQGGLFKESIEFLEKVLALDPSNQTIQMRIGDIRQQRVKQQIQKLEILRAKDPQNKELVAKLKKAQLIELKTGLETFKNRVEAFPNDLTLKQTYGEYLFQAKKYKEALSQFQKAIADPKVADQANEHLARCFMELDKPKMALKPIDFCLSKALSKSERWKDLLYLKGQCLKQMNEDKEATSLFEQIYEVDIDYKDVAELI